MRARNYSEESRQPQSMIRLMSHFLIVPINENGVITDENIGTELALSCSTRFGITDVFCYSHGWWTTSVRAVAQYNRFSVEFVDRVLEIAALEPPFLSQPPGPSLAIGLHWPSMLSEDNGSPINFAELGSYYTMEKRADAIGEHGLYSILRAIVEANQANGSAKLRFHFLGHSFGCKVVCSALQTIMEDEVGHEAGDVLTMDAVLLQAAFENNDLEDDGIYECLTDPRLKLRLLVTHSSLDKALGTQFPLAHAINIFAKNRVRVAMGFGGPTPVTQTAFGGCYNLTVTPGFVHADYAAPAGVRLVNADISALHQANVGYPADDFGGHHSDIYIKELYELIAAFLFR